MYTLELFHKFSAAHKLNDYIGACANVHGHTWEIKIVLKTQELVKDMVIDFKDIKKAIDERFDHKFINDQVDYNPTAENISKDIYNLVRELYVKRNQAEETAKPVIEITVWESDKAAIIYSE